MYGRCGLNMGNGRREEAHGCLAVAAVELGCGAVLAAVEDTSPEADAMLVLGAIDLGVGLYWLGVANRWWVCRENTTSTTLVLGPNGLAVTYEF